MVETFTYLGVACILAAIVGGGLEILGYKIPIIGSLPRQLILAVFGVILIGSVRIEAIRTTIANQFPRHYYFKDAIVRPGTWERMSVVPSGGTIRVSLTSVAPEWAPDGRTRYEPRIIICPPSKEDSMTCPWRQFPAGNIFEQPVTESGAYSVLLFNYAKNPPLTVNAEVRYTR